MGPRPDSQRLGRRIGPPLRPLPPPAWAVCQPRRRDAISAADFDRTVVRAFRRIKTRRLRGVRKTLGHSHLPFLPPRDAAATRASMAAGEKRGRRRRRPPRRCARSARARVRRRRVAWRWCLEPAHVWREELRRARWLLSIPRGGGRVPVSPAPLVVFRPARAGISPGGETLVSLRRLCSLARVRVCNLFRS